MPDDRINDVDQERLQVSRGVSEVVKQAASILQRELADSSTRATQMQQKYATTKRVDPNEFKALSDRVRKDVHDLIAMASEMFSELRTEEVQSLVSRMATDAHEVVDTTLNLVENTPAAAGAFARFGFTTPTPGVPTPFGDPPVPDPGPDRGGEPPTPNV
jgi:uncharacterized membrane protein YccC